MNDQLDGFDFVKIEYGRRFYAYNLDNNFIVFWFGSDEDKTVMVKRLQDYGCFKNTVAKDFTRTEALKYYAKAFKANEKAMMAELDATSQEEPEYAETYNPLMKWRFQPRF